MTAAPKIPADETLRSLLKGHLDDHDLIANLGSFARRMHFMKAFAHYEVFKLIQDLPGDIVECGVYKGSSLLSFARFLETFCPGDRTRKVLGFDTSGVWRTAPRRMAWTTGWATPPRAGTPAPSATPCSPWSTPSTPTPSCRCGRGSSW